MSLQSPTPSPAESGELLLPIFQKRFAYLTTNSPIYNFLLAPCRLTHVSKGRVVARLTLTASHMNSKGGIHGSVSATIVDAFGGLAITSIDGRERTGASVDIHVSYLGMATEGDEVEIEGKVDKLGGSLAFTTIRISKVKDGEVLEDIVLGRHTKFVRGTAPSQEKK